MSDNFVKDPHQVVKAGDVVKVKVMSIDIQRRRIGLSMRLSDDARDQTDENKPKGNTNGQRSNKIRSAATQKPTGAMAQAFNRLKKERD
jgi:uncharacterized protein